MVIYYIYRFIFGSFYLNQLLIIHKISLQGTLSSNKENINNYNKLKINKHEN